MKIAATSLLSLINFWVLKSSLNFIPLKEISSQKKHPEIPLNIDYQINVVDSENNLTYQILVEIHGNQQDTPLEGYQFSLSVGALFQFTEEISDELRDKYLLYSGLPMILSMSRGYLANITSYGIYGKYLLPAIDINSIIK